MNKSKPSVSKSCEKKILCLARRSTHSISNCSINEVDFSMADIMKLMQQAQQMQGKLQEIQEGLEKQSVTATSGGGMVTVSVDGKGTLAQVKIDPSVVNASDVEMLEDL